MCRMISFLSTQREKITKYFDALVLQAKDGKKAPHGDGWGMALYDSETFIAKKSSRPVWEENPLNFFAHAGVFHARKTTSSEVKVGFSHPFFFSFKGKDWAFVHNGSIVGFSNREEIDTQFFLRTFENFLRNYEMAKAVRKSVEKLSTTYEYTSLNFLLLSRDEMYAFRILSNDDDEYHSIFFLSEEKRVVFSTEVFDGRGEPLENGEFVHVVRARQGLTLEKGRW